MIRYNNSNITAILKRVCIPRQVRFAWSFGVQANCMIGRFFVAFEGGHPRNRLRHPLCTQSFNRARRLAVMSGVGRLHPALIALPWSVRDFRAWRCPRRAHDGYSRYHSRQRPATSDKNPRVGAGRLFPHTPWRIAARRCLTGYYD